MVTSSKSSAANSNSTVEDLLDQLQTLRGELGSLSKQFVRYVDQEGDTVSRALRQAVSDLTDSLNSYGVDTDAVAKTIRTKSEEVRKAAVSEVRRHPLRSVAVTVGVGLILGALLRGK